MDSVAFESWIADGCCGYEHNTRDDEDTCIFCDGFTSCRCSGCAYGNNIEESFIFSFQFPNGNCEGIGAGDGTGHGDGCNNHDQFRRDIYYGYGSAWYGKGNDNGSGEGWYNEFYDHYTSCTLITHNNQRVYYVDYIPCLPRHIKNEFAFVDVIGKDMRIYSMVIVKGHGLFAHGKTIKEAVNALEEKRIANIKPSCEIKRGV